MTVRPQIINPNYTLSQSTPGQNIMNQIDNNMHNYLPQNPNGLNLIPNNNPNTYDYNQVPSNPNYQIQDNQNPQPNQIALPTYNNDQQYNLLQNQPQQNNQDPNLNINPLPFNIPINGGVVNNLLNNQNSLIGNILDNLGNDDRKKKNNEELKKTLLEQIERKKCK